MLCELAVTCLASASRYAGVQQLLVLHFLDDVKLVAQSGTINWMCMSIATCMSVDKQSGNVMSKASCKYGAKSAYSSACLHIAGLTSEEADFVARLRKAERQGADPRVSKLHNFL